MLPDYEFFIKYLLFNKKEYLLKFLKIFTKITSLSKFKKLFSKLKRG